MSLMQSPSPSPFAPAAISPETGIFLEKFEAAMRAAPSAINTPIADLRRARASGSAVLPIVRSPNAESATIEGPTGPIELRIFRPKQSRGLALHFHGGGFVMGGPDQQDPLLERLAHGTSLTVVSASYRLAPEHPFPAAVDDCETAALWAVHELGKGTFRGNALAIAGESAGAYLALMSLIRLRDRHGVSPFGAALLTYGAYDLSLTPSARNWGDRFLLISTPILKKYLDAFAPSARDRTAAHVSPLYADLSGLPAALFTVGTLDPLLDDSLFLSQRWAAAGNQAELAVYPGGIHAFNAFPLEIGRQANQNQIDFLNRIFPSARELV